MANDNTWFMVAVIRSVNRPLFQIQQLRDLTRLINKLYLLAPAPQRLWVLLEVSNDYISSHSAKEVVNLELY